MAEVLKQSQLEQRAEDVKRWYNGYRMGSTLVYNPWSIANCIAKKTTVKPYWVDTSDNYLVKELLVNSDSNFKMEFESLLLGKTTQQFLDEHLVFGDLD